MGRRSRSSPMRFSWGFAFCALLAVLICSNGAAYRFTPRQTRSFSSYPRCSEGKRWNVQGVRYRFLREATPEWTHRPDEEVFQVPTDIKMEQLPLFDALYNSETGKYQRYLLYSSFPPIPSNTLLPNINNLTTDQTIDDSEHSISQMSVREISEAYQFSMPFLGDFMIQLGCREPLDIDTKICKLLTGEQIFSLLNALTTLDAYESNAGYDSMSLRELAKSLDVTKDRILRIAKKEELNLPFGLDTVLHLSLVEKIRDGVQYDEYSGIDDDDDYLPSGASDEFMDVEFEKDESADDDVGDTNGFYEIHS